MYMAHSIIKKNRPCRNSVDNHSCRILVFVRDMKCKHPAGRPTGCLRSGRFNSLLQVRPSRRTGPNLGQT